MRTATNGRALTTVTVSAVRAIPMARQRGAMTTGGYCLCRGHVMPSHGPTARATFTTTATVAIPTRQPTTTGNPTGVLCSDRTEHASRVIRTDTTQVRGKTMSDQTQWDTTELQRDFRVVGFLAPYVVVVRKSDGVKGVMQFTHNPRVYFGFEPSA